MLPGRLGLEGTDLAVSIADIAVPVGVFLGVPLAAGFLTRTVAERTRGRNWYEARWWAR